ncbi:PREDICTED: sulfotransferase family cytosolic 1B member 1 [Ceratosolen solmsi marchali]|uniref:Sulfotransferase family cytosolic 1B member 1 n=1 Tax=Ceratosolen solmsi marchali TaxID=326594 RepID=A0AAJ6VKW1_9HYME|nr:PREDICTED: sulfotransferase family cytosolic 1B member 1 [Ceratosolen solmsi marchali]
MNLELPKYQLLDIKKTKEMLKYFKGERTGWVQVGDKKWFFPYKYTEQGEGFYKFVSRSSDTWVLSYPRSGTTWVQELVWLIANNMDFDTANTRLLSERFPFLEFSMFNHEELTKEFIEFNKNDPKKQEFCKELAKPGYEVLANYPSPRFIKSHFPLSLLPNILKSKCKIVYVSRNPKDVAVSWFKLNQAFKTQGYEGDFMKFWSYFRNDLTAWSPYWEHLKEAWDHRKDNNFLFLFYEELQQNLSSVLLRVANFFEKSYTPEQMIKLENHLNIKNFRDNCMVNLQELKDCGIINQGADFVRKGTNGEWRNYFNKELAEEANEWINENVIDIDLRYSLTNNNCL